MQMVSAHAFHRYNRSIPNPVAENNKTTDNVLISKSISVVTDDNFNQNIYNSIKHTLKYFDYINHLDLMVTNFDEIGFNVAKRMYDINRKYVQTRGMSIKFAKYALLDKSDEVKFENGADEESVIYQMLYNMYMLFNPQEKYIFNEADVKSSTKIECDNIYDLNSGVFMLEILINKLVHTMIVVVKNNKIILFDPSTGVLDITNSDIFDSINFKAGNNKFNILPVIDKNIVTIREIELIV